MKLRELLFRPKDGPEPAGSNASGAPTTERVIPQQAYAHRKDMTEFILPEGLITIEKHAFWNCTGLTEITVPESVRRICDGAFGYCASLKRVTVLGRDTVIEDGAFNGCKWGLELNMPVIPRVDQRLHMFGATFLVPQRSPLPSRDHTDDPFFRKLADRCISSDHTSMWELAEWFQQQGDDPFYQYASNFWKYRAMQYGNPEAEAWLENWIRENPDQRMRSLLNEYPSGTCNGDILRGCGFSFFLADREYTLARPDNDGVVEVFSWSSTEDPDSDGFGMEECYDWWFLDSSLQELPGVPMFHDFSHNDRRANQKRFQAARDAAANVIASRRHL